MNFIKDESLYLHFSFFLMNKSSLKKRVKNFLFVKIRYNQQTVVFRVFQSTVRNYIWYRLSHDASSQFIFFYDLIFLVFLCTAVLKLLCILFNLRLFENISTRTFRPISIVKYLLYTLGMYFRRCRYRNFRWLSSRCDNHCLLVVRLHKSAWRTISII